ncbi:unnamed protein product (macronuclear) [Paramecium tetraurelia]|uniref:Uncharacterized protein n=1 Tax=Paramecium tetraurelia TaxID=5888 RepID=A0BC51_PARTE|nr:uncharacterized protein GSPATT00000554001 [Paramecium tetraurelia]CAK56118.1 unnamed protein product [Paramecium tetraurelia]|eukprot:XP_001423516.1 hypothetical protein (macronuclear) [Paramecium tetraurelia strain d4-2]
MKVNNILILKNREDLYTRRKQAIFTKLAKEKKAVDIQQTQRVNKMLQISLMDIENFTNVCQSYEFNRHKDAKSLNSNRDHSISRGRCSNQIFLNKLDLTPRIDSCNYWYDLQYI